MVTKSAGRRRPANPKTALPFDLPADEKKKWAAQEANAMAALSYWETLLDLRRSGTGTQPPPHLSAADRARLLCIIRAVSWVESKHGTVGVSQPARDPMQCGNPLDAWWKELNLDPGKGSRFVGGPDAKNHFASDLPGVTESDAAFPAKAKFSALADPKMGHKNATFGPVTSYYWGVPYLIHRINTKSGRKTFDCGNLERADLIAGAVAYNGKGDRDYEKNIVAALDLIGCAPEIFTDTAFGRELVQSVKDAAALAVQQVQSTLALAQVASERPVLFPRGIEKIDIRVKAGVVEVSLIISGPEA